MKLVKFEVSGHFLDFFLLKKLGGPCSQHVTGNTSRQNQPQSAIIKGLRPVLEGFVVPMQEGACETGSQIPRV